MKWITHTNTRINIKQHSFAWILCLFLSFLWVPAAMRNKILAALLLGLCRDVDCRIIVRFKMIKKCLWKTSFYMQRVWLKSLFPYSVLHFDSHPLHYLIFPWFQQILSERKKLKCTKYFLLNVELTFILHSPFYTYLYFILQFFSHTA